MKKINIGDITALLMDIESPETPFFGKVGDLYKVTDIMLDPYMPSGYAVKLVTYGGTILIDRSAVVHIDDWKNIYNASIKQALSEVMYK